MYASMADKDEDEIKKFCEQLNFALRMTRKHEITIVFGDLKL